RTEKPLFVFEQRDDIFLVPEMVAAGDEVHPGGENLLGRIWRDAGTPGGIFAVGNHHIEFVLLAESRNKLFDGTTAGFTHDVADEKQFHAADSKEKAADCRMEAHNETPNPKHQAPEKSRNRNTKNQAPNTKEIPSSKLQTAARASSLELGASLEFGAWCLVFWELVLLWSLEFGIWRFFPGAGSALHSAHSRRCV